MLTLQAASRPKRRGSPTFPYKHTFEGVFNKKTLILLRISGFKKRRRLMLTLQAASRPKRRGSPLTLSVCITF
jgi:hypothetical protein